MTSSGKPPVLSASPPAELLADTIGVRAVYVFGGLLLLGAGALGLARLRPTDLAMAGAAAP